MAPRLVLWVLLTHSVGWSVQIAYYKTADGTAAKDQPNATKPMHYANLTEALRDFCYGHDVTLVPGVSTPHEKFGQFSKMLHACNCVAAVAEFSSICASRNDALTREMFPATVRLYKLLVLWGTFHSLITVLSLPSSLNSQVGTICQLSFDSLPFGGPIESPLELKLCNVLAVDSQTTAVHRDYLVVEHEHDGYWFRLWAAGRHRSICSACGIIQMDGSFRWYNTLNGVRLHVGVVHNPPHWRLKESSRWTGGPKKGMEQEFVEELSHYFNFTFVAVPESQSKFGGLDGDRWSGMIGQVTRKEVDFSLGGLSVFYLRYMFVDFVYPFITDVFAFVTKTPTRKPLTQAILYPFQRPVWAGLVISLVMAWAGLQLLRRWTPREQLVGSEPGIWFLLAALVRQSDWSGEYRTVSFRCLVGAWLALSLVAANAYSCLLHSVMSVPAFGARVSTVEELEAALLAGKMTAGTANGTAQARDILDSKEGTLNTIRRLIEKNGELLVPRKSVGLDKALREDYAYIDTRMGLRGALADMNATTVEVSSGNLGNTYFSMAIQKTCFYKEDFSKISQWLVESGHFIKWEREEQPPHPRKTNIDIVEAASSSLDLSDFLSHLVILLGGYTLALAAFGAEHCWRQAFRRISAWNLKRPRNRKKTKGHSRQQQRRGEPSKTTKTACFQSKRWETAAVKASDFKRVPGRPRLIAIPHSSLRRMPSVNNHVFNVAGLLDQ